MGSANKNIGEAFLLVWKFPEELIEKDEFGTLVCIKSDKRVQRIADLALFSFLKIIAKINKLKHILAYRNHS